MNRKIIKIIFISVVAIVIIGIGIGLYIKSSQGPIVGKIEFGTEYYLTEIRPTERFAGATIDSSSYFKWDF